MKKIRIGISSCLLGEKVRYDGGHKLDLFLKEALGKYVEYIPVCPEVECGLGVPRKSMRLEGNSDSHRLIVTSTREDITEHMISWAQKKVVQLEKEDIRGFIFKSKSPSCGIEKVKIYNEKNMPFKAGEGIFAGIFIEYFPSLLVQDEESLHDLRLRDKFAGIKPHAEHDKFHLDRHLSAVLRIFKLE
jgi:uncharacterized protein YbbK (DUF523 family)